MATVTKPLTDKEIKAAKPKEKAYKLFDGGGLFLSIPKSGQKRWRLKYRFHGKEKLLSLGIYPIVSLSAARKKRDEFKRMIAEGLDPSEDRRAQKEQIRETETKKTNTFYIISQKWLESYSDQVSENYHTRLGRALENYIYPTIKEKPIDEVTRLEIIAILEGLKKRGIQETARRVVMLLNKVFRYAVTHEYTPHNIIADIEAKEIIGKKAKRHYPTLTKPKEIKGLLLSIDDYSGDYFTKMALKVLPYVFVRSYNIRHMEWKEIDLEAKAWIIPAEKMKTKEEFILPLPHQVITLLEEIKENSLSTKYVFPSFRSDGKPLSDNTLISALRRMGYTKEDFVPHGFRAMFSTIAHKYRKVHGEDKDVIEASLAHKNHNETETAYNRYEYLEEKKILLQWYADFLEGVKHG